MHNNYHISLIEYIIKLFYIYKFTKVLIAISGGQDSIVLLKTIQYIMISYHLSLDIEYIYIDHQWKLDSKQQAIHLSNYLYSTNDILSIYQINQQTLNENNARESRYKILINHAIQQNFQCIITAHTQIDKIETFLLNLIRGTSVEGATSLTLHRQINSIIHVIRPLINIDRNYIHFLCKKLYLPIWSDYTNYDYTIHRNRLRHELLPYIKNYFNYKIEDHINQFLQISTLENEYIKQNTLKLYLNSHHNNYIALNYPYIYAQHIVLQIRILQLFFIYHFKLILPYNSLKSLANQLFHSYQARTIIFMNLIMHIDINWIYIL